MSDKCPICGCGNDCSAVRSPNEIHNCWCFHTAIPQQLLDQVPEELRNKSCICARCVQTFIAAETAGDGEA